MSKLADDSNVSAAAERLFRLYHKHCVTPDQDTLFNLLEAGHSLNDRLETETDLDFFDLQQFAALKCLRNYFHHRQELRHTVRIIPIGDRPIKSDLLVMCLMSHETVDAAIEETVAKYREATRQACHDKFHWYGSVVNINPCLFNFVALAYQRITNTGIAMTGEAVEQLAASYRYEEEHEISHLVDGRLSTSAGNIDRLLMDIVEGAPANA